MALLKRCHRALWMRVVPCPFLVCCFLVVHTVCGASDRACGPAEILVQVAPPLAKGGCKAIAAFFGLHTYELVVANQGSADCVSGYSATCLPRNPRVQPPCQMTHSIQASKDSCDSIAKAYGLTTQVFVNMNPGIMCLPVENNVTVCVKAGPASQSGGGKSHIFPSWISAVKPIDPDRLSHLKASTRDAMAWADAVFYKFALTAAVLVGGLLLTLGIGVSMGLVRWCIWRRKVKRGEADEYEGMSFFFQPDWEKAGRRLSRARMVILWPLQKKVLANWTVGELLFLILWPSILMVISWFALENAEKAGDIAGLPFVLLWQMACRNSIWTWLLGIPFERGLRWHIFSAYICIAVGVFHAVGVHVKLARIPSLWDNHYFMYMVWTGWAMFGMNLIVILGAMSWKFRRQHFKLFYYSHIILMLLLLVSALVHLVWLVLLGFALWLIDIIIRYVYMAGIRYSHTAEIVRLPADILRVTFPRGNMTYSGGQYVFICVPDISLFEWHPFSLSSSPHQETVSLHIRVLGNWTSRLYELAGPTARPIKIYMEGPYGRLQVDTEGYQTFLMVSGGIGITPLQSITNELLVSRETGVRAIKKIWFVWTAKDRYMIDAVLDFDADYADQHLSHRLPTSLQPDLLNAKFEDDLDPESGMMLDTSMDPDVPLHVEFYLTAVREEDEFENGNIAPKAQPFVHMGRPDLPILLCRMRKFAMSIGEKRVAVLTCGPAVMVDELRQLCWAMTDNIVSFDFHGEVFEF